jgi:hypothetical protein
MRTVHRRDSCYPACVKILCLPIAAALLASCATQSQREMRAANSAVEAAWKTAGAGDWAAARAQAASVPAHVRAGIAARPVRSVAGVDLDLRPLLAGWEINATRALTSAAISRDRVRFSTAMQYTLTQCAACHSAVGKPDTKIFQPPALSAR